MISKRAQNSAAFDLDGRDKGIIYLVRDSCWSFVGFVLFLFFASAGKINSS